MVGVADQSGEHDHEGEGVSVGGVVWIMIARCDPIGRHGDWKSDLD